MSTWHEKDDWFQQRSRESDAYVLRFAVRVLRRRSRRPKSFWLGVVCRVLETAATRIEQGGLGE